MAVHEVGGEDVEVTPSSRYTWFYRRQGVSIDVSPSRHWWCAWLCSTTTEIDEIHCDIVLSGVVENYEASGSCSDCGSLKVMGPSFWGAGVPQAYQQARYSGAVRIDGQTYEIAGSVIY